MRSFVAAIFAARIPKEVQPLAVALLAAIVSLGTVATIEAGAVPNQKDQSRVALDFTAREFNWLVNTVVKLELRVGSLETEIAELKKQRAAELALPVQLASLAPVEREPHYAPKTIPSDKDRIIIPTPFGVDIKLRARVSTACLPGPLKAALGRVQRECSGFQVVSANRPGARVRGSGKRSLHASCKAADIQVSNPICARKLLAKWPGGMSTDYRAVNHFHISYAKNSGEWGHRFAHRTGKTRYAKRSHRSHAKG